MLKFIGVGPKIDLQPSEISITNETNKALAYLQILAGDAFLVVDLESRSTVKLEAQPATQKAALSYISCKGRFTNGESVSQAGENFNVNGQYLNLAHYSIIIRDSAVVISSKEFNKYEFAQDQIMRR